MTIKSSVRIAAALLLAILGMTSPALAQQRGGVHYRHRADMMPGAVARDQLHRGGPLRGYFQPVEIRVPPKAKVSLHVNGKFEPMQQGPLLAGMLIGPVYRLKVTGIPGLEGMEVYPTIEVVNRLYPPPGLESRFPIPVELSQEELAYAISGRYVTRVVYLEDPRNALPVQEDPTEQRFLDVGARNDPLKVADQMGRPMLILRMGSRIPAANEVDPGFGYGSPPLIKLKHPQPPQQQQPQPNNKQPQNNTPQKPAEKKPAAASPAAHFTPTAVDNRRTISTRAFPLPFRIRP